jgi:hypothetical protein
VDVGWDGNGRAWVWRRRLHAWEEESVGECVALLCNIILQDSVQDSWRWTLNPNHGYSVKEAYRYITDSGAMVDRSQVDDVWSNHIPSKVSLLGWRLLRNRLPTKDNLVRRGILSLTDGNCVAAGCNVLETASHLFMHCNVSDSLWSNVRCWLGIDLVYPAELRHHFIQFTRMSGLPRTTHLFFTVIWFATIWVLWKERNNCVFQNTSASSSILLERVKQHSFLWLKSKQTALLYSFYDWWKHPLYCMGVCL